MVRVQTMRPTTGLTVNHCAVSASSNVAQNSRHLRGRFISLFTGCFASTAGYGFDTPALAMKFIKINRHLNCKGLNAGITAARTGSLPPGRSQNTPRISLSDLKHHYRLNCHSSDFQTMIWITQWFYPFSFKPIFQSFIASSRLLARKRNPLSFPVLVIESIIHQYRILTAPSFAFYQGLCVSLKSML